MAIHSSHPILSRGVFLVCLSLLFCLTGVANGKSLLSPKSFSGGRASSLKNVVEANAEVSMDLPDGPAAVRELEVRLEASGATDVERQLRGLVVQLAFDGEVTAWCPATVFFGSGVGINELHNWYRSITPDGTMTCRRVMPYARRVINQVRIDQKMTMEYNVQSRTRNLDGIPFHTSLKFDMDLIAWKPTTLTYAATTHWYALPGCTSHIKPQPDDAARPIPTLAEARTLAFANRPGNAGAIECEEMVLAAKTEVLTVGPQDMEPSGAERWSQCEHLIASAKTPGARIELEVPTSDKELKQIVVYATQAPDYGILKFNINGKVCDATFDGYANNVQPSLPVKPGVHEPKDGKFLLRAEVAGANQMANGVRFLFALDCVVLEDPQLRTIHGQPSVVMTSPQVELAVTQLGGHMAPVTFYRDDAQPVQPYHISPWQFEPAKPMPVPVLVPLRGDFFCIPFGGNEALFEGEKHPPHGETAGSLWQTHGVQRRGKRSVLTMSLEPQVRKSRIVKELTIVDGQNVVYSRHSIDGFAGRVPLGHHATLAMPEDEGTVRVATSPLRIGMTYPGLFADPKQKEYQSLQPGSRWKDLFKVPVAWKGEPDADLSRLPARTGHADLLQLINEVQDKAGNPAWTTATFTSKGYVWFAFKDPAVLASTVIWIENKGRHGHPWNGRNNCIGLEDVTAYFADGLAASANDNLWSKEGIATAVELTKGRPTHVNYIQGVVKVPSQFDIVKTIEFSPGKATFISSGGERVTIDVHHEFIKTGDLENE